MLATGAYEAFKTGDWKQLVPTALGLLGSLGGAALGTLALPGVGTLAGGIGGGMAGEALGEWLIGGAAKGAMVDKPTLFMAGEEGLPEMIVPVGRMAKRYAHR